MALVRGVKVPQAVSSSTLRFCRSASSGAAAAATRPQPQPTPRSSVQNVDDQLLQRSTVPTMHFQKSLPRLPIPKLEDSLKRYLRACEPLLSSEQFKHTEGCVKEFGEKEGPELHSKLVGQDKNQKHTSYISELWFDTYLAARTPLLLNYNPFISMNDDPNPEKMQQAVRAADLVYSALRFRNSLQQSLLEPDVYHLNAKKSDTPTFRRVVGLLPEAVSWYGAYLFKAFPLDMSQYNRLFGSTRIPQPKKDTLFTIPDARHLAVLRNGTFYVLDVFDQQGRILPASELANCFRHILKQEKDAKTQDDSIAVMSTEERSKWADFRQKLLDEGNESSLRQLDSALFLLCLDDCGAGAMKRQIGEPMPAKQKAEVSGYCKNMLHGDGYNRWLDKSFSLIVDASGRAGVNFEHAWGDGVAVLRFVNEVYKDTSNNNFTLSSKQSTIDPQQHVRRLDFRLNDNLRSRLKESREKFNKIVKDVDVSIMEYQGYGKEEMKHWGFYPDAIMQLAFQMAYFQLNKGAVAPTYESCSTAAFKHGRTECIRSATPETASVSRLIFSEKTSDIAKLRGLVKQVCERHAQLTKEAAMGQGFDRHLFALKNLAAVNQVPEPKLFKDEAYARMNHNILSTSTLQSPAIAAGGFGPVVSDGYGVGYSCMDRWLGSVVFSYRSTRDCHAFTQAVYDSLDRLKDVMKSAPKSGDMDKAKNK